MPDMVCSFIRLPRLLSLPIEPLCEEEPMPLCDPMPEVLPMPLCEEEPMPLWSR